MQLAEIVSAMGEVNIVRQSDRDAQVPRSEMLLGGGEVEIVGPVGDQFVAEAFEDLVAANQKSAGHALDVSGRKANKVAFEPRHQHTVDAFAVEILAKRSVGEAKSVIEFAFGIGEAGKIVQFVRREEFRGALFGAKMDERQASSL